jgi:hypothetical protein
VTSGNDAGLDLPEPASTDAEVKALARQALAHPERVRQLADLDPFERQRHEAGGLELKLRKKYAEWILYGVGVQLAVADTLFFLYAGLGVGWKLSAATIDVWLGATVVQVIGVVTIVTHSLFPALKKDAPS